MTELCALLRNQTPADGPARFDHIADVPGLLTWSERVGILTVEERDRLVRRATSRCSDAAALSQAHRLRHLVQEVFTDIATLGGPEPNHWSGLRPFTADAVARADLTLGEDSVGLSWSQGADLRRGTHEKMLRRATALLDVEPDRHPPGEP